MVILILDLTIDLVTDPKVKGKNYGKLLIAIDIAEQMGKHMLILKVKSVQNHFFYIELGRFP